MQWKKLLFKTIKAQKKHKKAKVTRYSARDLKNIYILLEKLAEGLGSRRECCWSYISAYEKPLKKVGPSSP